MTLSLKMNENKQPKEPIGAKEHIKIRVYKRKPMKKEALDNWNWKARKKLAYTFHPRSSFFVKTESINTKPKLALTIARLYGNGINQVYVHSSKVKNKRYKSNFECTAPNCTFYQDQTCNIWQRYRKGWSCLANKRHLYNWKHVATIIIKTHPDFIEHQNPPEAYKYFKFRYLDRPFKMRQSFKWFWKDN